MCRKSMNAGASLKDTKKLIDDLKAMLIKDAGILDGGAAEIDAKSVFHSQFLLRDNEVLLHYT